MEKKRYSVTGTFHGSIVFAYSEGDARRIFHSYYNGESITHLRAWKRLNNPIPEYQSFTKTKKDGNTD